MPPAARAAPDWAPLPVQYIDYTLWQREHLGDLGDADSRIVGQVAYWERALAGLPARLELPTDRPYPAVADYAGALIEVVWPAELHEQVAQVARQHDATPFMVVRRRSGFCSQAQHQFGRGGGLPDRGSIGSSAGRTGGILRQHLGASNGPEW